MKTVLLNRDDIHKGQLILVNKEYRYYEQRQDLTCVGMWNGEEILYDRTAQEQLDQLMAAIGGWEYIVPVSAWRSMEEQQEIWNQSLQDSGLAFTREYVAVPGHSEHQTGLAIDLALKQPEIDFIRPYFPYEGICQKFREKAAEYGFVQRYQEEKQSITQIGHEPWHFRYVGVPHAEIMVQRGFALEEYIAFLRGYHSSENPFIFQAGMGTNSAICPENCYETSCREDDRAACRIYYRISYVKAHGEMTELEVDAAHSYSISGSNCDGFIFTEVIEKEEHYGN